MVSAPQKLTVSVGELYDLNLEANPTTGYTWMVKRLPLNLILVDGRYRKDPKQYGLLGSGGHYVYTVMGAHPGTSLLELIYGQTFDKSSWEHKLIEIQVK